MPQPSRTPPAASARGAAVVQDVRIPVRDVLLAGELVIPLDAVGLVAFAHGSGSSRRSPRNLYAAEVLNRGKLATLLFDLLTPGEVRADERSRELRFDIELLADRLVHAVEWVAAGPERQHLPIGCFGASTGAAAALVAAAHRPQLVTAVVSRGGRPDLAGGALREVHAPTLLVVGGRDDQVLVLNRAALAAIPAAAKRLEVIPGATHLFEEPGALEQVAALARGWFRRYLTAGRAPVVHTADGW
jgi:putative phosphoribosyl transferase